MKKDSLLPSIIGLLIGFLAAGVISAYAVNNDHHGMMRMMGMLPTMRMTRNIQPHPMTIGA